MTASQHLETPTAPFHKKLTLGPLNSEKRIQFINVTWEVQPFLRAKKHTFILAGPLPGNAEGAPSTTSLSVPIIHPDLCPQACFLAVTYMALANCGSYPTAHPEIAFQMLKRTSVGIQHGNSLAENTLLAFTGHPYICCSGRSATSLFLVIHFLTHYKLH